METQILERFRAGKYTELLSHLNTLPLQQGDHLTRALVVFNPEPEAKTGRVRFQAAFPIRAEHGAQPVTVLDETGTVVPSRLTRSELTAHPHLPEGRLLWTLELEFIVSVPVYGWRAYAALFADSPESRSKDTACFDAQPYFPLPVHETECHSGQLPLIMTLDIGVR